MNRRILRHVACLMFIMGSLFVAPRNATAHIEDYFDSVHFNCGHPDFGIPPRRAIVLNEYDDRPVRDSDYVDEPAYDREGVELTDERDALVFDRLDARTHTLSARAASAVASNDWRGAVVAYRALVRLNGWSGGLRDRLAVITAETAMVKRPDSQTAARLRRYLHALALDDVGKRAASRSAFTALLASHPDKIILPHVEYQLASLDYEDYRFRDAESEYQTVAISDNSLRPAALLMLARCHLLLRGPTPADVAAGRGFVNALVRSYPPPYYRVAIEGLQARVAYLTGHYTEAIAGYERLNDLESIDRVLGQSHTDMPAARAFLLAGYLRRLGAASSLYGYETAADDINRVRDTMTMASASLFSQLLRRDAIVAAPYFYYRLYLMDNTPKDLKSLAGLADSLGEVEGNALPASVAVKLAEVYYQYGEPNRALLWANRSMAARPSDRALYVRGACLLRMGRYAAASADFAQLLAEYGHSPLSRGAREELALAHEATGDFAGALDQYLVLGYQPDIAYLLDVRMSELQVHQFLISHLHTALRNELMYTYGIRCLRDERWHEAALWLGRVPKSVYRSYGGDPNNWWFDTPNPGGPLVAVRGLAVRQEAIGLARTRRGRAEAMYAYASYYYTRGTLLLYNARLWNGSRAAAFCWWWDPNVETPANNSAVHRYMYDHEVYARCLSICQTIARRYPDTPTAPQALYRAACCLHNLSNFNDWWRSEDDDHGLEQEAIQYMRWVYARYPNSPLAPAARKFAGVFEDETAMYQPVRPISANNLSIWIGANHTAMRGRKERT